MSNELSTSENGTLSIERELNGLEALTEAGRQIEYPRGTRHLQEHFIDVSLGVVCGDALPLNDDGANANCVPTTSSSYVLNAPPLSTAPQDVSTLPTIATSASELEALLPGTSNLADTNSGLQVNDVCNINGSTQPKIGERVPLAETTAQPISLSHNIIPRLSNSFMDTLDNQSPVKSGSRRLGGSSVAQDV